jgi:hypothetical protein
MIYPSADSLVFPFSNISIDFIKNKICTHIIEIMIIFIFYLDDKSVIYKIEKLIIIFN